MTPEPDESRLYALIAEYLVAAEGGTPPDREELLRRHPDLAERLRAFFADHDSMLRAATPVRASAGVRGSIRYTGDYEILDELGSGGMGVVYRARQKSLDRLVAVKVIVPGLLAGDEVKRFRAEAEAVAALDHPGIVPLFEVGQWDADGAEPVHYFSMKLVDGGTLAGHLDRYRGDPRSVARLIAGVARAVHHAHERGILHRDLKPANILLGTDGRAYVSDFGLARRLDAPLGLSADGAVVGTAGYMPPEQAAARSAHLSPASDVYSLGAILYAVLTGRPPFRGATQLDTLIQVIDREPLAPRQLNPDVPADLETVVLRCLDKRPQRRYASAAALADDLEAWAEGRPIRGRRVGLVERGWLWCRRRPFHAGLAAAVILLAILPVLLIVLEREPQTAATVLPGSSVLITPLPVVDAGAAKAELAARQDRKRARYLTYLQELPEADAAWHAGDVAEARRVLNRLRPPIGEDDVRGWEWFHLDACCSGYVCTLPGKMTGRDRQFSPDGTTLARLSETHIERIDLATGAMAWSVPSDSLYYLAWSPDGHTLAALPGDARPARLFDATTGKTLLSWRPDEYQVDAIAWRLDGKRLAIAGDSAPVRVCNADGKELLRLAGGGTTVAWSPDGTRIAVGGSIYDAETGRLVIRVRGGGGAAWSPDGRKLVVGDAVWDVTSGLKLVTLAGGLSGERQPRWSADGKRIFTDHPQDSRNRVAWNPETGQVIESPLGMGARSWSRDGRQLALRRVDAVVVWDPETGGTRTFPWDGDHPVWSWDGKRLVVGAAVWEPDRVRPAVRFAPTSRSVNSFGKLDWVGGSHHMSYRGGSSGKTPAVYWDIETGRVTSATNDPPSRGSGNPDGKYRALHVEAEFLVKIMDHATGREVARLAQLSRRTTERPLPISWSPDGRRLAALSEYSGALAIWTEGKGEVRCQTAFPRSEFSRRPPLFLWSRDGKRLVTAWDRGVDRGDSRVECWNPDSGARVYDRRLPNMEVRVLAGSPDGRWVVAGGGFGGAVLFAADTGEEKVMLQVETNTTLDAVAWSPDSSRLAVSAGNRGVAIWCPDSPRPLCRLPHALPPVVWSPDGRRLGGPLVVWEGPEAAGKK